MKTSYEYPRTCRLCGKHGWADDMIKYGTRAYAHPACFIKHKSLDDLDMLPEHQRVKLYKRMERKRQ